MSVITYTDFGGFLTRTRLTFLADVLTKAHAVRYDACYLKVQSHYSVCISVCSYARIRSQTLIYVRGTLGIRRYVPNTLTYVGVRCVIRRDQIIFW